MLWPVRGPSQDAQLGGGGVGVTQTVGLVVPAWAVALKASALANPAAALMNLDTI